MLTEGGLPGIESGIKSERTHAGTLVPLPGRAGQLGSEPSFFTAPRGHVLFVQGP